MSNASASPTQLRAEIAALRQRLEKLEAQEQEWRRTERVQAALYRIADITSAAENLPEFYATMHDIVGEFMDAVNFGLGPIANAAGIDMFLTRWSN